GAREHARASPTRRPQVRATDNTARQSGPLPAEATPPAKATAPAEATAPAKRPPPWRNSKPAQKQAPHPNERRAFPRPGGAGGHFSWVLKGWVQDWRYAYECVVVAAAAGVVVASSGSDRGRDCSAGCGVVYGGGGCPQCAWRDGACAAAAASAGVDAVRAGGHFRWSGRSADVYRDRGRTAPVRVDGLARGGPQRRSGALPAGPGRAGRRRSGAAAETPGPGRAAAVGRLHRRP